MFVKPEFFAATYGGAGGVQPGCDFVLNRMSGGGSGSFIFMLHLKHLQFLGKITFRVLPKWIAHQTKFRNPTRWLAWSARLATAFEAGQFAEQPRERPQSAPEI